MMKGKWLALIFIAGLFTLAFALPRNGLTRGGIVVNNADSVDSLTVLYSPDLILTTDAVTPRVVSESANSTGRYTLTNVPGALATLFTQVTERVVFEFANSSQSQPLVNVPPAFATLLNQTAARIVFEFANSNQQHSLHYPGELIDDNTPPQASGFETIQIEGETAVIWTTNEFATSILNYGTQPGTYTTTITDPLFVREHAVIADLTPGVTYYCRVSGEDISGNSYQSQEFTCTVENKIYLPIVVKP